MPQPFIGGLSISKAPLQASTSSSWARSGKPSRTRNSSSFQDPCRIFTLPARHCELNGPNRVSLSPVSEAASTVKPSSARTRCCAWLLPACPGSWPTRCEPVCRPCAVLQVRIHLPPAESQVRTCLSREFAFLDREAAVFAVVRAGTSGLGRQRHAGAGETVLALNRNWVLAIAPLGYCKFITGSIDEAIPAQEQAIRLQCAPVIRSAITVSAR